MCTEDFLFVFHFFLPADFFLLFKETHSPPFFPFLFCFNNFRKFRTRFGEVFESRFEWFMCRLLGMQQNDTIIPVTCSVDIYREKICV